MNSTLRTAWAMAMFVLATAMGGASPTTINYQGRLTGTGGGAVTTQISVVFTFWDAVTGGNQLGTFADTDQVTPDLNGIFTTEIGDDPLLPIPESLFAGSNVWLNVAINGENLAPRKRFSAVGYALNSSTVRGGDVGRMEFTAAEAISAGSIVLLKDDGTVRRAAFSGSDSLTTLSTRLAEPSSVLIAPNKILMVGSSKAMVATFDSAGGNIQMGAATVFGTSLSGAYISTNVIKLADDKALILYQDSADNSAKGVIVTASGLTLSYGPVNTLSTTQAVPAATLLSTNKLMVVVRDKVQVATISGNTITPGPEVAISYAGMGAVAGSSQCCLLGTDKALVVCAYAGGENKGLALVVTVSGTTPALGPVTVFNSFMPYNITHLAQLDADKALLAYVDSSFISNVLTFTASGNTLTFGTEVMPSLSSYTQLSASQIALLTSTKFFYCQSRAAMFGTVSGTDVTLKAPVMLSESDIFPAPVRLSDNSALVAYTTPSKSYLRVVSDTASGPVDFSQRIGVAETSVSVGQLCLVTIPGGITGRFTGLVPGKDYYVTETGIGQTGTNLIGHALTPNKLQVWR